MEVWNCGSKCHVHTSTLPHFHTGVETMPRKGPIRKRPITPDPVFNSALAQRFINRLLLDGKKSVAERIFYGALDSIEKKANKPGLEVFEAAVRNVMPVIEVRPRRV